MVSSRDARETSTYLAWQSHFGVRLQVSRLRDSYVKGTQGAGVQLVDASGLILALWRLRLAAQMSRRIEGNDEQVTAAISEYDCALPGITKLRHVTMHFDEYALETDNRRNKVGSPERLVEAKDLWNFASDPSGIEWLGVRLDYDKVEHAARKLYDAIQNENNAQLD